MKKIDFSRHDAGLYGAPLKTPNRDSHPAAHLNMTLPLPQNYKNFDAHLCIGFHPNENSSKVTKRFVPLTRQPYSVKNHKGASYQNPITHPTPSDVTSSTISTVKAQSLINGLRIGQKFLFLNKAFATFQCLRNSTARNLKA